MILEVFQQHFLRIPDYFFLQTFQNDTGNIQYLFCNTYKWILEAFQKYSDYSHARSMYSGRIPEWTGSTSERFWKSSKTVIQIFQDDSGQILEQLRKRFTTSLETIQNNTGRISKQFPFLMILETFQIKTVTIRERFWNYFILNVFHDNFESIPHSIMRSSQNDSGSVTWRLKKNILERFHQDSWNIPKR